MYIIDLFLNLLSFRNKLIPTIIIIIHLMQVWHLYLIRFISSLTFKYNIQTKYRVITSYLKWRPQPTDQRWIVLQFCNYICQLTIQHTSLFSSMIIFSPEDIVNLGKFSGYLSGLSASLYTRRMSGLTKKSSSAESFSFRFMALHRSAKSSSTSITSPTTRLVSGLMEEKYFKVAESMVMFPDYNCVNVISLTPNENKNLTDTKGENPGNEIF